MKCEVISIGDELLIGQTINTNASWIGEQLNNFGFTIAHGAIISDNKNDIILALNNASNRSDIIIITGGLGPTNDDITKHTLTEYFNTSLERNKDIEKNIVAYFKSVNRPILKSNLDQALLPLSCEVLSNSRGTASGMWFEKDNIIYISLPGVPYEMKGIMQEHVFPKLLTKMGGETVVVNKTIRTHGMGESFLAEIIKSWEDKLEINNIKLAYLPSPGIVKLRLSVIGLDKLILERKLKETIDELKALIPDQIYGYGNATMEGVVGKLLKERNLTIATAESCTGGSVAKMLTSISGSSSYFNGAIVSYNNQSKVDLLNVDFKDIDDYGAVSQQVVEQMAEGVRNKFHTDYGISTSGIAGPSGGTKEKPVGTVWIAVASKNRIVSKKIKLGYNRERNMHVSSISVLNLLRLELLKN
ncbi:MAG: competence/damage-inducible protein A [Bacteroidetes bacterium MED-G20]|nr:MAG: competence/damage-inducible protein A [Bacteroidetes bacterium MED-G20]|tara:strand:+ start:143 stop:1390 length:1248 start_codon:yes stop_codon:yes gene_type:complete